MIRTRSNGSMAVSVFFAATVALVFVSSCIDDPPTHPEMNDYQFKLAKGEGEFVWHKHDDTDEVFIVIEGNLEINFRDGSVELSEGIESAFNLIKQTVNA